MNTRPDTHNNNEIFRVGEEAWKDRVFRIDDYDYIYSTPGLSKALKEYYVAFLDLNNVGRNQVLNVVGVGNIRYQIDTDKLDSDEYVNELFFKARHFGPQEFIPLIALPLSQEEIGGVAIPAQLKEDIRKVCQWMDIQFSSQLAQIFRSGAQNVGKLNKLFQKIQETEARRNVPEKKHENIFEAALADYQDLVDNLDIDSTEYPVGERLNFFAQNADGDPVEYYFEVTKPKTALIGHVAFGLYLPVNRQYLNYIKDIFKWNDQDPVTLGGGDDFPHAEEYGCAKLVIGLNAAKLSGIISKRRR